MEDEAAGDADLVAEAEAGVRADIIELNEPHSHTLSYINVNATSQGNGEGRRGMREEENVGCCVANGLMRGSGQNMHKG